MAVMDKLNAKGQQTQIRFEIQLGSNTVLFHQLV